jgi:phosphate/phosphite/phosphonate ABC transporter binding protein
MGRTVSGLIITAPVQHTPYNRVSVQIGRLLSLLLFGLLGCGLIPVSQPTFTPSPPVTPTLTPAISTADATPGSAKDPLILALAPSAQPSPDAVAAGKTLAALLEKATGYKFEPVIPPDETELVKSFGNGNADIGVLSPYGYLLASNQGYAQAAFVRQVGATGFYSSQFIAQSDSGFTAFFDPGTEENSVEAAVALLQFKDKKPCWTDQLSPSGFVVPLGYLGEAGVPAQKPAFLASHASVVRAIYAGGICDFGATYVDARAYPGLQDAYPDVLKKVVVVWRIPPIIPYETLVFVNGMNEDMRRNLTRAFVDLMSVPDGNSVMQTLYGFNAMQVVQDSQYDEFRKAVKASGLDLTSLIK